jgi:hypothetical protein
MHKEHLFARLPMQQTRLLVDELKKELQLAERSKMNYLKSGNLSFHDIFLVEYGYEVLIG